jgi:hypothetical protein
VPRWAFELAGVAFNDENGGGPGCGYGSGMQKQLNSFQDRQGSKLETVEPKMIEGKALNKKIA